MKMLRCTQCGQAGRPPVRAHTAVTYAAATAQADVRVRTSGSCTVQGTSRKRNEDRLVVNVSDEVTEVGEPFGYAGVFDGHGGDATACWLVDNLADFVETHWTSRGAKPEYDITEAFVQADRRLLAPKGGFFGSLGERGVGGSKCGSTAAIALLFPGPGGGTQLLTANVGDARVLLSRGGRALQLTVDHVPDSENERVRIERTNPNPKMKLVRYVAGTWRVGGILALSRAFGDAYMKGSLQFEGVRAGGDGYSSGFGVTAEPDTTLTPLTPEDTLVLIASDGLFANEERGGGGGLTNQEAVQLAGQVADADDAARRLVAAAQDAGSTDDVTVVLLRLK